MSTVCLRVYVSESSRYQGKLTYEWLLDEAQRLGIGGGSAFRALAGFGRHGRHDEGFFELAGELPVVVEFFLESVIAEQLLASISQAGLKLIYAQFPAEIGITQ
ncbi:MAG TPA: DUF190 domain-containing protein [Thiobacillus sp.]